MRPEQRDLVALRCLGLPIDPPAAGVRLAAPEMGALVDEHGVGCLRLPLRDEAPHAFDVVSHAFRPPEDYKELLTLDVRARVGGLVLELDRDLDRPIRRLQDQIGALGPPPLTEHRVVVPDAKVKVAPPDLRDQMALDRPHEIPLLVEGQLVVVLLQPPEGFLHEFARRVYCPHLMRWITLTISPERGRTSVKRRPLQARRIRMVFVADRIPAGLQRIVEFLNEQMDPAEVLAIEVRQFTGQGITTLAPRIVGQTSAAQRQKGAGAPPGSSFQERLANTAPEVQEAAGLLDRWATGAGLVARDGPGSRAWYAGRISVLNLNPASGAVQFGIEPIRQAGREAEADAVHALLSQIAGRTVAPHWPTLPCSLLVARWQTIEQQLLPSYLSALLECRESNQTESSGSAGE
jgi:hypothetical protein